MAEDHTKIRSVTSPAASDTQHRGRMNGKRSMQYSREEYYGYNTDKYQRMPVGEMKQLKDNTQADYVYDINTSTQQYDLGRMRYDYLGTKGNPRQAYDYDY